MAIRLYWKDELIAESVPNQVYPMLRLVNPDVERYKIPFGLFKNGEDETAERFIKWAKRRCFPPDRIGVEDILKDMGLDRYDRWEIVKLTNAKMPEHDWFSMVVG